MLDVFRRRKRIAQIILLLLVVPFAFFGIEHYFSGGPSRTEVARVGDGAVTVFALKEAIDREVNRLRQQAGESFDPAWVRQRAFVEGVLRKLIERELILAHAREIGLTIDAEELRATLRDIAAFQRDGRFDYATYEAALRSQGLTPARFEALLREDLTADRLAVAALAGFAAPAEAHAWWQTMAQVRRLGVWTLPLAQVAAGLSADEATLRTFFAAHPDRYTAPARYALEYVLLEENKLQAEEPDETTLRQWWQERQVQFQRPERRRVRHLFVPADAGNGEMPALLRDLAGGDEAAFLAAVQALAHDPVTKREGGALGWVVREDLPPEVAEAVFAAAQPGVVGPIATAEGWHVFYVQEIAAPTIPNFEAVKEEVRLQWLAQERRRRFNELVAHLPEWAYDAVDRLQPVAERIAAPVEQTQSLPLSELRLTGEPLPPALQQQLAREEARRGENLEPVALAPDRWAVVRVRAYEPERALTFEEARQRVEADWRREEALRQAKAQAEALRGKNDIAWQQTVELTRLAPQLPEAVVEAAFALTEAPSRQVVVNEEAVWLIELQAISPPAEPLPEALRQQVLSNLAQRHGQVEYRAWLATLERRIPVRIRREALNQFVDLR